MAGDGLAYVRQGGQTLGRNQVAEFDPSLGESVLDAAEDCPQDCIYIEA